ncbi:ABC transporter ATP-binding protein [Alginatibacterium sediminis]|uniref:ABC transporter ATP-binding protein n=1 Tax=Alginatibacterium sediminis TaxID=2164068 RepID=A0A420EDC1_9ALTE|nr:ABC transporter ATP-binding protein [Alginatibacterium sediminis]RKF18666.1 ABC transporter ATP-binding protein [Alginatibacterium sediminis]
MPYSLRVKNLHIAYGKTRVLKGVDLDVKKGEMIALLGPSGCGKTTLLNALCGFLSVDQGQLMVGSQDISNLPAEARNMAMVFQSYALWPHMSVFENIAYGLRIRKYSKIEINKQVEYILQLVKLQGLEHRCVTQLSGGQRQRVALARALAIKPPILLLDEPLSNLDTRVRLSVRHEIKTLQKQLGFTSIIVTHDREEAMVMADRVVVLNQGRIEQVGTPEEIYQQPATPFVADFMGADNHIKLKLQPHTKDDIVLSTSIASRLAKPGLPKPLSIYFRSQEARINPELNTSQHEAGLDFNGVVEDFAYLGQNYRYSIRSGEHFIQVDDPRLFASGSLITVKVPRSALHVFDS